MLCVFASSSSMVPNFGHDSVLTAVWVNTPLLPGRPAGDALTCHPTIEIIDELGDVEHEEEETIDEVIGHLVTVGSVVAGHDGWRRFL